MPLPRPSPQTTVLITGASSGIGAELARRLAERGHNLVLVARRADRLEQLAEELRRAHGIRAEVDACDLGDGQARRALVERVEASERRLVGLCNNAGYGSVGLFHQLDPDKERRMVELNVRALHELCVAFIPAMVRNGAGAVLNVGSSAGFQPLPKNASYSGTKAFVNTFSEALHADLSGTGVSCTVLCPGPVVTEFAQRAGYGQSVNDAGPSFVWVPASEVAAQAVRAMVDGKRVVVPGAATKAAAVAGRFTPRSVLLPLARRFAPGG